MAKVCPWGALCCASVRFMDRWWPSVLSLPQWLCMRNYYRPFYSIFRVPNITCLLQDYYDMENCRFAKWVDPPNHQHIEEYISYLKDRIHELEGKVKSLEEDEDKKTPLVVSLEDDPLCPDPFCKCPYHPRSDWPPKSPPSGGYGFYEEGGSSHFPSAHYA